MRNKVDVWLAVFGQRHGLPGALHALGNPGQISFGLKKPDFFHIVILLVGSTSLSDNEKYPMRMPIQPAESIIIIRNRIEVAIAVRAAGRLGGDGFVGGEVFVG